MNEGDADVRELEAVGEEEVDDEEEEISAVVLPAEASSLSMPVDQNPAG